MGEKKRQQKQESDWKFRWVLDKWCENGARRFTCFTFIRTLRGAKRVELVASHFVGTHRGVKKVVVVHAFYFIIGCVRHIGNPNKTTALVHLNIRFEAIEM